MAIHLQILGEPGRDNALWVRVDTGQRVSRLLFDCGAGCPEAIPSAELQQTDDLYFSHGHMDHISGFDAFFRPLYNRTTQPNRIWGPPGMAAILHHRFQGYWWNLHASMDPVAWTVHEVHRDGVLATRYELREAFATAHPAPMLPRRRFIQELPDYTVEAIQLEHHGPTLGYLLRERPRTNVRLDRLQALGLTPGPWLQTLKGTSTAPTIEVGGKQVELAWLRAELLTETPGESLAYLTDFRVDDAGATALATWLQGCTHLVCEAQYIHTDLPLAERHSHMTTRLVGELAAQAHVGSLTLFHLSERYEPPQWRAMLLECQSAFPAARYPAHWAVAMGEEEGGD